MVHPPLRLSPWPVRRQSLLHLGRPLSEYNLSPLDAHCLQHTHVTPVTPGTRASCSDVQSIIQPHSESGLRLKNGGSLSYILAGLCLNTIYHP